MPPAALRHPFFPDRAMRIIADAELVDPTFGTGAVKITPAHDANDYRCGKKHGLAFISVIGEDGRILHRKDEPLSLTYTDMEQIVAHIAALDAQAAGKP